MKPQAQVVDFRQYKEKKAGGRQCGGALYNSFHSDSSSKNISGSPPGMAPPGQYWKLCRKRGWILKKQEQAEPKHEETTENIDNLVSKKKQEEQGKNEQEPETKKDELSMMVKISYIRMQREITEQINSYRRVWDYRELNKDNKKIVSINEACTCPLCGSELHNEEPAEKSYSKTA